jgi:hypothetical protein
MHDVIYLALIVGFFAVAAALVRGCEAIVGSEDPAESER